MNVKYWTGHYANLSCQHILRDTKMSSVSDKEIFLNTLCNVYLPKCKTRRKCVKPLFHVQLLYVIIWNLGGTSCQSVHTYIRTYIYIPT